MKAIGIIPARFESTRFPGKPLVDIGGKTMIQRVYEQASKANLDEVLVATDDKRIEDHVISFGGKVIMTSYHHNNGTERVAEAAEAMHADIIINIQGDEPFIQPQQINRVTDCFKNEDVQIATLAKEEESKSGFNTSTIVKVVFDKNLNALYFSRSAIPYYREFDKAEAFYFKHIGIYGFRREVLLDVVKLESTALERAEMLEQLRWLENGYKIKIAITNTESYSVDVPQDLEKLKSFY